MTPDQIMGWYIILAMITSAPIFTAYEKTNKKYMIFYTIFNLFTTFLIAIMIYILYVNQKH